MGGVLLVGQLDLKVVGEEIYPSEVLAQPISDTN
jgi:hypothetical protein